jgi:GNAT superfamily N-acetyltransferase
LKPHREPRSPDDGFHARNLIFSSFPGPPKIGTAPEGHPGWRLGREWGGYPEFEWTFGIFVERVNAFGGRLRAHFYDDLSDFDTARLLIRVSNILLGQREPSYPTVGVSFEYFDSAYRVVDGRLPCDDTPLRGRHAVATVDHADPDEIKFPNTWDPPRWGDAGFGYVTREYFERHVDSVWTRWSASGGPSIPFMRCMERAVADGVPEDERLVRCWPTRNEFWTQTVGTSARPLTMLNWNVYSMNTGGLVEVIEIRDENQIVGRAHMFDDERAPTLRELFVHPNRRREGVGQILEGTAAEWARDKGADTLQVWLREADARERLIEAPLRFASSLGYEWEDVEMRRPNVVKIARRSL